MGDPEAQWGSTKDPAFLEPRNSSLAADRLHHLSSIIYSVLSSKAQKMSPFSNNINSLNTFNTFNAADHRPNILAWLSPLEPRLRHQDIQESRMEDIGEWLLQTEEFRSWCAGSGGDESDSAVLFCRGDPGAGKTYIR